MEHYPVTDVEEFNYGSFSPEEICQHENNGDFDWDQDRLFMINVHFIWEKKNVFIFHKL